MNGMPLSKSQYVDDVLNKVGRQETRFIFRRRKQRRRGRMKENNTESTSPLKNKKKREEKKTRPEIPAPNTQKRNGVNFSN